LAGVFQVETRSYFFIQEDDSEFFHLSQGRKAAVERFSLSGNLWENSDNTGGQNIILKASQILILEGDRTHS